MKCLLLLLLLFSSIAFAGFEKLTVRSLDIDYTAPYGKGTVEKVGIGLSLAPHPFDIELTRTDDSFELTSQYVDFSWRNPVPFIHDLEKVSAKKTSAALGAKKHFVESEYFMAKPKGMGEFKAFKVKGSCDGDAVGRFEKRLLSDCRNKMDLSIRKIDVPSDILLYEIVKDLPFVEIKEEEVPADHLVMKVDKGDYYFQVYVKYWVYAGLRFWGHVQFENNHEVVAVRVDQVKFGYLPVTGLVMKKLKETIKNPNVTVDPPWIRIKVGKIP